MKAHRAADAALVAPFRVNRHTCARACKVQPENPPHVPHVPQSPLLDLAARVSRLGPDRRNPEQFHEDKSEISAELRRLAREAGR